MVQSGQCALDLVEHVLLGRRIARAETVEAVEKPLARYEAR